MKINSLKVGTLLWIGLKGESILPEEKSFIQSEEISGVVLFKRNISSLKQVHSLCQEIHKLNPSPLIAIDREGAQVDRLNHLSEVPKWPSPETLAQKTGLKETQYISFLLHQELKALGVDINFAPCLDVKHCESELFKNRLFSSKSADVLRYGEAFLKGAYQAEVEPCIKHFPGHGAVAVDSHKKLPVDQRKPQEIQADLKVFTSVIHNSLSRLIMTAHVLYKNLDPKYPATLSQKILSELKKQMSFSGLLISDDLNMKAISCFGDPLASLVLALNAGVDVLLHCQCDNSLFGLLDALKEAISQNQLSYLEIDQKISRIKKFQFELIQKRKALSFMEWRNILANRESHLWCKKLIV